MSEGTSFEEAFLPHPRPLLIILSGPSGVGKDAAVTLLRERDHSLHVGVTATTRPRRPNEIHGRDYYFLSASEFRTMIADKAFLEWANVYGNLYGVPKGQVHQAMAEGRDALIKADVQGAATFKRLYPQAVFIFLSPPSLEELVERLRQRKTEDGDDLSRRIETAHQEMGCVSFFDYVVVNKRDALDEAVDQIRAIITAEKCRVTPRVVKI